MKDRPKESTEGEDEPQMPKFSPVRFWHNSITQDQYLKIGRFLKSCGVKLKECETNDGRICAIKTVFPGYNVDIYCGIKGQSIDVTLQQKLNAFPYGNPGEFVEQFEKMMERRRKLIEMGYVRLSGSEENFDDSVRLADGAGVFSETYTKPVATHHTDTVIAELKLIHLSFAPGADKNVYKKN